MYICWSVQWTRVLATDQILYQIVKVKTNILMFLKTQKLTYVVQHISFRK